MKVFIFAVLVAAASAGVIQPYNLLKEGEPTYSIPQFIIPAFGDHAFVEEPKHVEEIVSNYNAADDKPTINQINQVIIININANFDPSALAADITPVSVAEAAVADEAVPTPVVVVEGPTSTVDEVAPSPIVVVEEAPTPTANEEAPTPVIAEDAPISDEVIAPSPVVVVEEVAAADDADLTPVAVVEGAANLDEVVAPAPVVLPEAALPVVVEAVQVAEPAL